MSSASLEADLRDLGIACTVEARGGLALLVPAGDPSALGDAAIRREAVRLAEAHGFTHIAVELHGGPGRDRTEQLTTP